MPDLRSGFFRPNRMAKPGPAAILVDLSVLLWGIAYCLSSLEDRDNAGRITNLDVFGSIAPVPSLLEWFALCTGTLAILLMVFKMLRGQYLNLAVPVTAIMVTLIVVEGALRVYFTMAPMTQGFPSNAGQMWDRRYVRLNTLGWRDTEHSKLPDPGVRRLPLVPLPGVPSVCAHIFHRNCANRPS